MKPILCAVVAASLAGCATAQPETKVRYIKVKTDSYCKADRELKWSQADTPKTINDIRRHNQGYRKSCKK